MTAAGWTNIALGLLIGVATLVGFVADSLGGAESSFFILVACLLVAVGAFSLATKLSPVVIFGFSLLFLGLFLGFGLLVGGSVFGAADGAPARVVGILGFLLALLEVWTILALWRNRTRSGRVDELGRSPEAKDDAGAGDAEGRSRAGDEEDDTGKRGGTESRSG